VEVVDEQHQRAVRGLLAQHRADLGHDGDQVAPLVGDAGRQQVGEGAERHRTGSLRGRGPGDVPTGTIGQGEALVGQPGLAHTGRSVDDEPVRPGIGQGGREQVELVVPAHQRPLQRQCSTRATAGG
jgi:hypothetical protein